MNTVVWKFAIPLGEVTHLMLPRDAEVVYVGQGHPGSESIKEFSYVWIEASFKETPEDQWREYLFAIFVTGEVIPPQWEYAGTFFDGPYVGHVYTYGRMI